MMLFYSDQILGDIYRSEFLLEFSYIFHMLFVMVQLANCHFLFLFCVLIYNSIFYFIYIYIIFLFKCLHVYISCWWFTYQYFAVSYVQSNKILNVWTHEWLGSWNLTSSLKGFLPRNMPNMSKDREKKNKMCCENHAQIAAICIYLQVFIFFFGYVRVI